jgi:hypothetical protein
MKNKRLAGRSCIVRAAGAREVQAHEPARKTLLLKRVGRVDEQTIRQVEAGSSLRSNSSNVR